MSITATIRADQLGLLLASAKLRQFNHGRTAQFCILSRGPVITTHCHDRLRHAARRDGRRFGLSDATLMPMQRGGIAELYERVNLKADGRKEVRHTWGCGIRALRAEPRHVLNGGRA
jgi:hypothetical protein